MLINPYIYHITRALSQLWLLPLGHAKLEQNKACACCLSVVDRVLQAGSSLMVAELVLAAKGRRSDVDLDKTAN